MVYFRSYQNKHSVQAVWEVREDKVDKFLELIPALIHGSRVYSASDTSCLNICILQFLVFRKVLGLYTMSF